MIYIRDCSTRDPKMGYKIAKNGEIDNFTGIYSHFENPVNPDLIIDIKKLTVKQSVEQIIKKFNL